MTGKPEELKARGTHRWAESIRSTEGIPVQMLSANLTEKRPLETHE